MRKNIQTEVFHFFLTDEFSQWYPSTFTDPKGREFSCAEQWMMVRKAEIFGDEESARLIMLAQDPADYKAIGRAIKGFDPAIWAAASVPEVIAGNLMKFSQNPELWDAMDKTGDRLLVEAASYDKIWGIGLKAEDAQRTPPSEWDGTNHLGISTMAVRAMLRMNPSLVATQSFDERKSLCFEDASGQRTIRFSPAKMAEILGVAVGGLSERLSDMARAGESVEIGATPFYKEGLAAPASEIAAQLAAAASADRDFPAQVAAFVGKMASLVDEQKTRGVRNGPR